MNNFTKKAIALASVICVAFTSTVSCLGKEKDSSNSNASGSTKANSGNVIANNGATIENIENENGNVVITPFQFGTPADLGISAPEGDIDLNSADPETTTSGEPATEIVEVTEANGEKATDADGNVVTQIVTKPTEAKAYTSKIESRYCLWIDISKDSDYIFNDQFIKITFKLKDDIPEQDYAIRFNPDLSSVAGKTVTPDKVLQGTIRVGGNIEAQDVSKEAGFVAYGDNISAKPGDTVDYYLNLKNNPGLAAILVWVYYDSNAMELQGIKPAGEFAGFAKTRTGTKE